MLEISWWLQLLKGKYLRFCRDGDYEDQASVRTSYILSKKPMKQWSRSEKMRIDPLLDIGLDMNIGKTAPIKIKVIKQSKEIKILPKAIEQYHHKSQ